jgi:hypothetical protein
VGYPNQDMGEIETEYRNRVAPPADNPSRHPYSRDASSIDQAA